LIVSYSRNFIFIKPRKVGGTSVEIVLSSWCSGADVCTPITPREELVRLAFGGLPRNFALPDAERRYVEAIHAGDVRTMRELIVGGEVGKPRGRRQHAKAVEVREVFPDIWPTAFKFSIDRHPYERAISFAYFVTSTRGKPADFSEMQATLEELLEGNRLSNAAYYMARGKLLVDAVFRYEDMWRDLTRFGAQIGCDVPAELPRAMGFQRHDRTPAAEVLTPAQKKRIASICAAEFDLLGYEK